MRKGDVANSFHNSFFFRFFLVSSFFFLFFSFFPSFFFVFVFGSFSFWFLFVMGGAIQKMTASWLSKKEVGSGFGGFGCVVVNFFLFLFGSSCCSSHFFSFLI